TLVIRTNWDQSPDANGSYELSYDNNWAAVCVSFERDIDGNLINFVKTEDCGIIFDCNGVPFGGAVPDCVGNCPGIVAKGDLNNSGELDAQDISQYINDILGNDSFVTPCTDLNNDGDINVTDAAVAAGCVFYGPDHVDEQGVHDHCVWDDQILNPAHNTTFSIGEVNTGLGYVDIHVLNPDNRIIGYDLEVSGITVQSVENLMDPLDFDVDPASTLGGSRILGVSLTDQSCPKNLSPIPFVRVYYFSVTDTDVCVSLIHDVVNEDYHNVVTTIGGCMPIAGDDFANFSASSTTVCQGSTIDFADMSTGTNTDWSWSFSGGTPSSSVDQNPMGIIYNVPGVYDVTVTVTNDALQVDSETKIGYITVLASSTWYADADADGYGDSNNSVLDCSQPAGYVDNDLDCEDTDTNINPDADEVCDGIDNNCDGTTDDAIDMPTWYADMDGDTYGNDLIAFAACIQPSGFVADNTDCDDGNVNKYPGAPGTFSDIDNNCNGLVEGDEISLGCAGDFNEDLEIDISDLLAFLGAFGCTGDCMPYDMNQDAVVNSQDLLLFLPSYGSSCD
ncbi:MAG: PKD repeat protein, partial [Flavobacteriales bacterium]